MSLWLQRCPLIGCAAILELLSVIKALKIAAQPIEGQRCQRYHHIDIHESNDLKSNSIQ